jgi:hypothetical protein
MRHLLQFSKRETRIHDISNTYVPFPQLFSTGKSLKSEGIGMPRDKNKGLHGACRTNNIVLMFHSYLDQYSFVSVSTTWDFVLVNGHAVLAWQHCRRIVVTKLTRNLAPIAVALASLDRQIANVDSWIRSGTPRKEAS